MAAENRNITAKSPVRRALRWAGGVLLIVLVAIAPTPYGGWIESLVHGSGARWQDAYEAFETEETNLPRDPRERERLLLANAMVDSEPPAGIESGRRLHGRGTLARLRYETLDENNQTIEAWQVRALVPGIGDGNGPQWRTPCGRPCEDESAQGDVTRVMRSGDPGIAAEWVLRMPVGKTFEWKGAPLRTQDLLDAQPRSVPLATLEVGGRSVKRPAKIRVTLVEACAGRVRVGSALDLQFVQNVMLPIPAGFRRSQWVQLEGCGRLAQLPPPPTPAIASEALRAETAAVPMPTLAAAVLRRDAATGFAALKVDESWLDRHGTPVIVRVIELCRYETAAQRWRRVPQPEPAVSWRLLPDGGKEGRVILDLPHEIALFWLGWTEQNEVSPQPENPQWRQAFAVSGPVLCNDIDAAPAAAGMANVCLPFAAHAEVRAVPVPRSGACQP